MLEEPSLDHDAVIGCLRDRYGAAATSLVFLPLGADSGTAVYRVVADGGTRYFLKLRRIFDAAAVEVPHFLRSQGIEPAMRRSRTHSGARSAPA